MFWYYVLVECGRPRNETVSDIVRRTRAKYHYAIRFVKRNKDEIMRVRFAEALIVIVIFGEAKRLRGNKSLCSKVIDDGYNYNYITDFFAHNYKTFV